MARLAVIDILADVSLDQLRYFVTVAEVGTTREAARRLHISQPPLSRHIKSLEDELGTALFDRTAQGMRLRPAGSTLLTRAREILRAVDDAVVEVRSGAVKRRTEGGECGPRRWPAGADTDR